MREFYSELHLASAWSSIMYNSTHMDPITFTAYTNSLNTEFEVFIKADSRLNCIQLEAGKTSL